jgi:hypothetical protein
MVISIYRAANSVRAFCAVFAPLDKCSHDPAVAKVSGGVFVQTAHHLMTRVRARMRRR